MQNRDGDDEKPRTGVRGGGEDGVDVAEEEGEGETGASKDEDEAEEVGGEGDEGEPLSDRVSGKEEGGRGERTETRIQTVEA